MVEVVIKGESEYTSGKKLTRGSEKGRANLTATRKRGVRGGVIAIKRGILKMILTRTEIRRTGWL